MGPSHFSFYPLIQWSFLAGPECINGLIYLCTIHMFVYIWVIFCGQRPTKSIVTIIMFTLYYIVYIALWSSTFPFTVPITSITIISMTCILITINANLRHSNRNHARQRPDLLYLYLYFDFYLYFSCISVSSSLSPPLCSVPIEIVPDSALTPP